MSEAGGKTRTVYTEAEAKKHLARMNKDKRMAEYVEYGTEAVADED